MHYQVTVSGDYIKSTPAGKTHGHRFEETFKLPTSDAALSLIQNKLIHRRMFNNPNYPEYVTWRTCGIKDIKQVSETGEVVLEMTEGNIPRMDLDQLRVFCMKFGLFYSVDKAQSLSEARLRVTQEYAAKQQADADRAIKDRDKIALEKQILEMNELTEVMGEKNHPPMPGGPMVLPGDDPSSPPNVLPDGDVFDNFDEDLATLEKDLASPDEVANSIVDETKE